MYLYPQTGQGTAVGGGQCAGDASLKHLHGSRQHRNMVDTQLDNDSITGGHHLIEMSQQSKTGDVGASMDAARVLLLQGEELLQGWRVGWFAFE